MSAFKDAIASDITSVFINVDEFASCHAIDGVQVQCIIDSRDKDAGGELEGYYKNVLTIYVPASSLNFEPVEGELLNIDGGLHFITSVSRQEGLLVIEAEASKQ